MSHLRDGDINKVSVENLHRSGYILGKGRHGCVIERVYVRMSRRQDRACACKIYEATEFKDTFLSEFERQCNSYHKLQHRNLLAINGICMPLPHTKVPWLLFELMEINLFQRISNEQLPMFASLQILKEIADGLAYLHFKDIVHGDVSSSSILLSGQNHVKIGGFPFINSASNIQASEEKQAFMAPEVLSDTPSYGKPADLYSYACIAVHLMSRKPPTLPKIQAKDVGPGEDIYAVVERHKDNFDDAPPTLWMKIVKPCLDFNPVSRPVIDKVKRSVNGTTSEHKHKMSIHQLQDSTSNNSGKVIKGDPDIQAPVTIPHFLKRTFDRFPNDPALSWKDEEDLWQSLTYAQYKKLIYNVAKSFLKLGLEPYNSVGILGFNSVEWFASSLGAVFAGGLSTGIHAASNVEACQYILRDCQARIVVVTSHDQKLLDKIYKVCQKLPYLKVVVVQYSGELSKDYPNAYTWNNFLELGKNMEDSVIDNIIDKQKPHQCAMLVYTSGTTDIPKGVMLSHDNFTWVAEAFMDTIDYSHLVKKRLEIVSYLPLAHIAGLVAEIFFPVTVGGRVYFAKPDALKGSLFSTLREVQPTMFLGVPCIWEQVKDTALKRMKKMTIGEPNSHPSAIIKKQLGLENCVYMFSAAAQMRPKTLEFFENIGITILELYGLSECTGPHTASLKTDSQNRWKFGSCGKGINGTETKIIDKNHYDQLNLPQTPPRHKIGEILLRGRHVFMGYNGVTTELVDDDGWLHTGDVGWKDDDDFLYITCRKEDLIIMQDKIKTSPVKIEDFIKSEVPFLSNVIVIGHKRNYLTCLVTLKCIIDPHTGKATDDLQLQVIEKFKELGTNCTTRSQVIKSEDKAVYKAIQDGIECYNSCDEISEAQKIRKWKLLDSDFTIPGRELGPTYKVKRSIVVLRYAEVIEELYEEEGNSGLLIKLSEHHCFLKDAQIVSDKVGDYWKQITIEEHNITITIPKGAVEKGYVVEIKAGASFFGSFSFPEEYYHCVGPYLWIHTEYSFKKPLKVEMEHHAVVNQQEDKSHLCAMEGIKDDTDDYGTKCTMYEVADKSQCQFQLSSSFCTYYTRSKYTCLASKSTKIADKVVVNYWLPQFYESDAAIFHFCYDLKFYNEATENAYQEQGMIKKGCSSLRVCYNEDIRFRVDPSNEAVGWRVSHVQQNMLNANQLRGFSSAKEYKDACNSENPHSPCFKALIRCYGSSCPVQIYFHITTKIEEVVFDGEYYPRSNSAPVTGFGGSPGHGSPTSAPIRFNYPGQPTPLVIPHLQLPTSRFPQSSSSQRQVYPQAVNQSEGFNLASTGQGLLQIANPDNILPAQARISEPQSDSVEMHPPEQEYSSSASTFKSQETEHNESITTEGFVVIPAQSTVSDHHVPSDTSQDSQPPSITPEQEENT